MDFQFIRDFLSQGRLELLTSDILDENERNGVSVSSPYVSSIYDTLGIGADNSVAARQRRTVEREYFESLFRPLQAELPSISNDAYDPSIENSYRNLPRLSHEDVSFSPASETQTIVQAEQQEDVAPSDTVSASDINRMIQMDQSEEDRNLSGGITDAQRIGVNDANTGGVDESLDLIDIAFIENLFNNTNESVQNQVDELMYDGLDQMFDQVDFQTSPTEPTTRAGDFVQDPENSDFKGDIGVDTAVQSSLKALHDSLTPGPRQIQGGTHVFNKNGVSSNKTGAKLVLEISIATYEKTRSHYAKQIAKAEKTYKKIKNIESEIASIDNIVYALDLILSPEEKRNKARSRLDRLEGVKNIIVDELAGLDDTEATFAPALIYLYSICKSLQRLLSQWIENPASAIYLRKIELYVSPAIHYVSISVEKTRTNILQSIKRTEKFYLDTIESYQDSDSSERDLSKVLKFDVDISPSHNAFTKKMKRMFNEEIYSSIKTQRKVRKVLKAKTLLSSYNAGKVTDYKNNVSITKQKIATLNINTDNIAQKNSTIPMNAKTNSRRLNLLETPVAMKERKSVPYVNEYEKNKALFS